MMKENPALEMVKGIFNKVKLEIPIREWEEKANNELWKIKIPDETGKVLQTDWIKK